MQRKVGAQVQDEELVAAMRQRIVAAAIPVFRRKGFHESTTRDVALEAGITQSNIYNYVRSKGDILYLVCVHLVGLYHHSVKTVLDHHQDPYERIVQALRAVIMVMFEHREELVLLYNETHALDKADRKLILSAVARFTKQFEDLLDAYVLVSGQTRLTSNRLAANLFTFVPAILALRWWDLSLHVSRQQAEEGVFEFILGGLGIPAPGNAKPEHCTAGRGNENKT